MAHPENKPSIASAPISMVLPVQNQAAIAERAVPAWINALTKFDRPFELLLIDDGNAEADAARLAELAARHREVVLIRHDAPRGIGAALRSGFAQAKHPLLFYSALDYPYQTGDLRRLLERIDDVDLVSGFRSAQRLPDAYRWWRRGVDLLARILIGLHREPPRGWLGWKMHLYNRLTRTLFGQQLDDVESAYKLMRREALERMPLQSDGPFIHTEIIAKANFMTLWMDEVPIGAQSGVPPAALVIPFSMKPRWRDLRRVLFNPDFGRWPPPEPEPRLEPTLSPT